MKAKNSIQLKISSINPVFPLGISATGLSLVSKKGEKLYDLNKVTAVIPFWSLITLKPEIEYLLKKEKSEMGGTIKNIYEPILDITLNIDSPVIGDLFKDLSSMSVAFLQGKLSAEAKFTVSREIALKGSPLKDAIEKGKIIIKSEEGVFNIPGIPLSKLRDFSYDLIEAVIIVDKGMLHIDKLDIKGDLDGSIKGKVFLESPMDQSRMDFRLKLKPSEDLKKRAGIIMEIIKGRMGVDGFYSLDLKGNFSQPKPVI